MRSRLAGVAAALLVVAACGGTDEASAPSTIGLTTTTTSLPSPTSTSAEPTTTTTTPTMQIPDGLQMACGEAIGPYSLMTDVSLWLDAEGGAALDALAAVGEEGTNFTVGIEWGVWDRTDDSLVLFGTNERGNAYARFEPTDDAGWKPTGFGTCHWWAVPPDHLGIGTWVIDPAHPISEESTSVHVLATERTCTGGQPPTGVT